MPDITTPSAPSTGTATPPTRVGYYRWMICVLLLFAAIINYVDRQVIGILKPTLTEKFGWGVDERIYSSIVFSFQLAYAIGFIFAGRFMDAVGVRKGFAISVTLWSIAAAGHGMAAMVPNWTLPMLNLDAKTGFTFITLSGAAVGFAIARFALGLGEAGAFPASIKTVAEWFPKKERSLATGIFNSGTNVGALLTPLIVPWILLHWGWEWAFVGTGALGLVWVVWWLSAYREPEVHPRLSAAELAYIRSDPPDPVVKIPWAKLLPHRQTWAFAIGKFMTDPIWWFYLYWLPKFLDTRYGVSLSKVALPLITIYLVADVGSVGGGWLSGFLIKRGWSVNAGRKITLLIAALLIVPTMLAPFSGNMWTAVLIVSVAAAAHQWWSANLFTLSSDMFPQHAVGSVVGIGGFAGAFGGVLFQRGTGLVLQNNGNNYVPIFIVCGLAYVTALLIVHLLVPRMERAKLSEEPA